MNRLRLLSLLFLVLLYKFSFGQEGIINNGASIYMTGGATIYITGSTGDYLNENNGQISAGSSDSIKLEGNWINNASNPVFTSNGGIVSLRGGNQTIGGTNSTSFNTLLLEGTGTKLLSSDILVGGGFSSPSGALNLNSHSLNLSGHTLTISNPAAGDSTNGAIQYASGYIISEKDSSVNNSIVKWEMGGVANTGDHVFPFATASGVRLPVTFTIISTGNTDISISTRRTLDDSCGTGIPGSCNKPWTNGVTNMNGMSGNDVSVSSVIDRWWEIDASSAAVANMTLTYQGAENTTSNPLSGFYAQQWYNGAWYGPLGYGAGVTAGTGSVYIPSATGFGPIVLVESDDEALPLNLVSFQSTCLNKGVMLSWTTATENNTKNFTVERSFDGENFTSLGAIKAAGSSSSNIDYSYLDSTSYSTVAYYRLEETDMNGNNNYFPIITADCHFINPFAASVFPNPNSGDNLNVHLSGLSINADVQMRVVDILGRQVIATYDEVADDGGKIAAVLNLDHKLTKGIYNLVIQTDGTLTTKSFVVQ